MRIILASSSKQRQDILKMIGIKYDVVISNIDEQSNQIEPDKYVEEISLNKAKFVRKQISDKAIIIAADTIIYGNNKKYGKPKTKEEAYNNLKELSNGKNSAYTGITIIDLYKEKIVSSSSKVDIYFKKISDEEINWYVNNEEKMFQCCGYVPLGKAAIFIDKIEGDYNTLLGLSPSIIFEKFRELGYSVNDFFEEESEKMKKVLFATENESKAKRFKKGLLENDIEIITINDIEKKVDVEENGKTAIENALIKARAYAKIQKFPVFAMDDNLYIEGIPEDKQPGMYVRRVNGKRLSDDEMIEYYSNLAHEYGDGGKLTCRWVYGIAVINNGVESTYSWSKEDFYIVDKPSNKIDSGYPLNTISINKKLNKYFTDITEDEKKEIKEEESDVIDFLCKNL